MGRTLGAVICVFVGLIVCLSFHVYTVLHRAMPPGLAEAEKIRWFDELGRLARRGSGLMHDVGINIGIQPMKIFINTAFSILFNPLPWQRVVYRNIRVNQDVYDGVTVSTYTPVKNSSPPNCQGYPTIVYFHGGGWTWLSVGVYDGPLKNLANKTKFKVVAVEYRTAPQDPFPAAYDDCLAVTKYIVQHSKELNVCKDLIVVAGDGAGGNLAAAVAIELSSFVRLQILINPALQMLNFATPSYQDFSDMEMLPGITSPEKEITNWMRYGNINLSFKHLLQGNRHVSLESYAAFSDFLNSSKRLPSPLKVSNKSTIHNSESNDTVSPFIDNLILDSRFNPMFTQDVSFVADTYIITSQFDVLRDEALMFGHRLLENGVKVELHHYYHGFHGFFLFAGGGWIELKESQKAMEQLVNYLNKEILRLKTN
ncbi:neutral cholesterol ester hydrolase 1-like [Physella acuta]|uniref:neutral cholesterol ester hydrolase 1-like n=1 Tax=Physella acuta TaxID=109671 RepID=UPI0027DE9E69|nr:neutral cholesterol ester hydrolase 1-like [Physella acuta]